MSKLYFEIGKRYKHVNASTLPTDVRTVSSDGVFVCHGLIRENCMSMDVSLGGKLLNDGEGWCAASRKKLQSGEVIEVNE